MNDTKMDLWNAVCKTNPTNTKGANVRGNKITAIAPQTQIMEATKEWGSYGSKWGLKNIKYDFQLVEKFDLIIMNAVFYYPDGEFEIGNSMSIFVSKKKGMIDNDYAKKMETDTLTKALSKLGFNADVFMGLYDDNRYVQAMYDEFYPPSPVPLVSEMQIKRLYAVMGNGGLSDDDQVKVKEGIYKKLGIDSLKQVQDDSFEWALEYVKRRTAKRNAQENPSNIAGKKQ